MRQQNVATWYNSYLEVHLASGKAILANVCSAGEGIQKLCVTCFIFHFDFRWSECGFWIYSYMFSIYKLPIIIDICMYYVHVVYILLNEKWQLLLGTRCFEYVNLRNVGIRVGDKNVMSIWLNTHGIYVCVWLGMGTMK